MSFEPPYTLPRGRMAINKGGPETEEQGKIRFQIELEFVQCLGNPNYLNFLAQRGYLKDSAFIHYLKYLEYWKQPYYAKYIMYPVCLNFLELLQHESFRKHIANSQCSKFIDDQIVLSWQHYTRRRVKLFQDAVESQQPPGQTSSSTSVTPVTNSTFQTNSTTPSVITQVTNTNAVCNTTVSTTKPLQ